MTRTWRTASRTFSRASWVAFATDPANLPAAADASNTNIWAGTTPDAPLSNADQTTYARPGDVSGTVTLADKGSSGGHDYLLLKGAMSFEKMTVNLPEAYTLDKGKLNYSFEGRFPLDFALEPLLEKKDMTLSIDMKDKKDPKILLNSVTKQFAKIEKKPL